MVLTAEVQVRTQSFDINLLEGSFHAPHNHLPYAVLEPSTFDGVVFTQRLELVRFEKRPKRWEAALEEKIVESSERREEFWERIGFVKVLSEWALAKKGDAEVEVGERDGGQSFYEDVDDDVGIIEGRVELVARWTSQPDAYREKIKLTV